MRRRWMTTAVAAAAVLLIAGAVLVQQTVEDDSGAVVPIDSGSTSPTASAPSTMNSPPPEDYPPGLPPEGAVPSSPQAGELVATVARIHDSAWYLYADGRLISTGGGDWIERHLTPEGVEQVRSQFLSSGLFDPDQAFSEVPPAHVAPFWCACVRDGGRLLSAAPLPENQFEALESSRAVGRLIDYFKQLVSSASSDSWVDSQGKEFVASKVRVLHLAQHRGRDDAGGAAGSLQRAGATSRARRGAARWAPGNYRVRGARRRGLL